MRFFLSSVVAGFVVACFAACAQGGSHSSHVDASTTPKNGVDASQPEAGSSLADSGTDGMDGGANQGVVLVGAGDIARCNSDADEATAKLLDGIGGTVFTLGDNVYEDGTSDEFANCYHPTWGRHKARTRPAPGNHDYHTEGATGYYGYFGSVAGVNGYYSYDLGAWHIVVLNSNCDKVDCTMTSAQATWLKGDLESHPALCTLAYFHHPVFSSGEHGNNDAMKPVWEFLQTHGVDVVLAGHDHNYERFAPQNAAGVADPAHGIREFVVGTGGTNLRAIASVRPNSEVRNADTHGVLKLTLRPTGYDWKFVPVAGKTFSDSGSGSCH